MFADGAEPDWTNVAASGDAKMCLLSIRHKVQLAHIVRNAVSAGTGLFLCCGDGADGIEDAIDEILEDAGWLEVVTTAHSDEAPEDIADLIEAEIGLYARSVCLLAFVDTADSQSLEVCQILRGRWQPVGQPIAKSC